MDTNEDKEKSLERAKVLIELLLALEEMGEPTADRIEKNEWRGICSDGVEYMY